MAQGYQLPCPAEARRLLVLIGATTLLVIVFQYFEFSSPTVFSSFFTARNTSTFVSPSNPAMLLGNSTISGGLNSSDTVLIRETTNTSDNSNVKKEILGSNESNPKDEKSPKDDVVTTLDDHEQKNRNSSLEHGNSSVTAPVADYAMAPNINVAPMPAGNGSSAGHVAFPPYALPPIDALSNQSVSIGTNLSHPVMLANSSTSPVGKDGDDKDGNSGLSYGSTVNTSSRASGVKRKKTSKKQPSRVISISQMNDILHRSRASSGSMRPQWPSQVDQEVLFAKSQIEKAPAVENDNELYGPIYRNISMFKRSYELMENMLKVYVYKEGEKPIFHEPILKGIYASEGWFMKLMEENEKFVTEDPSKAHLFYFPFSSRLLELTLYVRKSHSRTNLIQYMKSYVDMMAAKYSFWNRTGGADHFVAACHDWAPAETRGRMLSCIRVLCNADIDVGFQIGKDVSLPETYVSSAENPLKNLEGNSPSERPILAFFAGNMHGYLRPILLDYWQNKDPDMKIFGPMPHVKGNTNYIQHMKSSKYCICPKGHEVNSPRIVESIFYECVPVIISDNYVPPFFEVLDWESFAVFVMEKDIPNLKNILLSISEERYMEMHKRVKQVQQHFLWHSKPLRYDLFHMILHSVWYNRVFQFRPS